MLDSEATAVTKPAQPLWLLLPSYLLAVMALYSAISASLHGVIGEREGEAFLIVFLVLFPFLVALTTWFLRLDGRTLSDIGFHRVPGGILREVLTWTLLTAAFLLSWLTLAALLLRGHVQFAGTTPEFMHGPRWLPQHGALALVLVALGFAVQGSCEEWVFRGYLQGALLRVMRPGWAVALTAAVFGLAHSLPYALPIGLLGAFFGWLSLRHRSLLAPIAAHSLHNAVTVAVTLCWPEYLDLLYRR